MGFVAFHTGYENCRDVCFLFCFLLRYTCIVREKEKIEWVLLLVLQGMRIAMTEADFEAQLESAKMEAMKSFGDQVMLLEKYVVRPRCVFK